MLIIFCLLLFTIVLLFKSRKLALKTKSYIGPYYFEEKSITITLRIILIVVLVYLLRTCGRKFVDGLDEEPPQQVFDATTWKKNENTGIDRHTMLQSLKKNHSFLLGKSQNDVIKILGNPDTNTYYLNTDSTLYWHSAHPIRLMSSGEPILIYFKESKSYKISIDGSSYTN